MLACHHGCACGAAFAFRALSWTSAAYVHCVKVELINMAFIVLHGAGTPPVCLRCTM
jgi:hypothetical protein